MAADERDGWIEYNYAVVRLVPHVHCAWFTNVGVLVLARSRDYLVAEVVTDRDRIARCAPSLDAELVVRYLEACRRVCQGGPDGGPIGMLPASERFHWLTSPHSTVMQTSPVHPGRCRDLAEAVAHLYREHCA